MGSYCGHQNESPLRRAPARAYRLAGSLFIRRITKAAAQSVLCVGVALQTAGSQAGLPRLERVSMRSLDSLGPEKATATVAISTTGTIAFTGAFDQRDRAVTILDSLGRVLARLGPPGQGPGELSVPVQLAFAGRELIVVEPSSRRISRFRLDGTLQGTSAMMVPFFLAAAAGDSLDVFQFPSTGPRPVLDFRRVSPTTLDGRTLFSGQSPLLRDLSEEGQQKGAVVASIVFAAAGSTVVAANVGTYRLIGIGANGNLLFDIRGRQAEVPAGETPLFVVGGLQVDAKERVWAIGTDHQTGRTFADLYLGSRLLGRLDLPCRGSVTLAGSWVAMLCTTPDSNSRDVALQIYRIVETRQEGRRGVIPANDELFSL